MCLMLKILLSFGHLYNEILNPKIVGSIAFCAGIALNQIELCTTWTWRPRDGFSILARTWKSNIVKFCSILFGCLRLAPNIFCANDLFYFLMAHFALCLICSPSNILRTSIPKRITLYTEKTVVRNSNEQRSLNVV